MNNRKQTIKCDVKNCKHNDDEECLCNLDSVDISCTCNKCKCSDKFETICNSFEEKE